MKSHKGAVAHSEREKSFSQKKAVEVKGPGAKRKQNTCGPAPIQKWGPAARKREVVCKLT